MGNQDKRDFNTIAKIILVLSMIYLLIQAITYWRYYYLYPQKGIYSLIYIHRLLAILITIQLLSAVLILYKKKLGLIVFIIISVYRLFGFYTPTVDMTYDITYLQYLGNSLIGFLLYAGLFLIALCFKKNGISGWQSFFASNEYIKSHYTE